VWESITPQTIINCWRKTEIVLSNKWSNLNWNVMRNEEADNESNIIDDDLEIEEIVLDEAAIIEEVLYQSDSSNSDEESDVEIEKILHSVALEQCSSLIQYVEQQEPEKFVKDQDLPQLRSLLRRIRLNVFKSKEQKK
ncbi:4621_t:CDS:2, partial [Scutellospora calospora]